MIIRILSYILPFNLDLYLDARDTDASRNRAFLSRRIGWLLPHPSPAHRTLPNWSMYAVGWIPGILVFLYIAGAGGWREEWLVAPAIYFFLFPVCFTFFCNIFRVRRFRELEWIWIFLLLNLVSIKIFDAPRWKYIIPVSLIHLGIICLRAMKDPEVALLSAAIELRQGRLEKALSLSRKASLLPEAKLVQAGCYARMGREGEARKIFGSILDTDRKIAQAGKVFPDFIFLMRSI